MPRRSERALLIPFCIATACGGHRVAHVAPDESRPHITWEIRTGGDLGDSEFVCGSVQPSRPCELTASTQERPVLTTVHVFLHAAAQQTNYLGVVGAPFVQGGRVESRDISATVPVGSRPVGSTLSGRVTSKAGSYTLSISVDANQPGIAALHRISERIPVAVK